MATIQLWINEIISSVGWTRQGSVPYLDAQDQPTNYIYSTSRNTNSDVFGFTNTLLSGTINSVLLYVYAYGVNSSNFSTYLSDNNVGLGPPTSWGWVYVDVSSILDTWEKINSASIYFDRPNTTNNAGVDAAYLLVDYTEGPIQNAFNKLSHPSASSSWNKIDYASEPPVSNAWNKLKYG